MPVAIRPMSKSQIDPPMRGGINLAPSPFRGGLGRGFSDLCLAIQPMSKSQIDPPQSPRCGGNKSCSLSVSGRAGEGFFGFMSSHSTNEQKSN